ncbi:MAG: DNA alkylation repair protein [bacterium]|nr:DNA alkylation repair protein [bacterium]
MTEKILLKDLLFNQAKVEQIAGEIHRVNPSFKRSDFVHTVVAKFPELELKARISWIADCLENYLSSDYKNVVGILVKALPAQNNPALSDGDFGDFIYAPYAEYVAKNGCSKKHLKLSLNALYEITKRFSVEDAIRYFINAFPQETLSELSKWSKDSHYHVRRLSSEGTRPKLPWSQKISIQITEPLPILDNLFSDNTRFVTRSVANHINDISKIDPKLAVDMLAKWKKSEKQESKEMDYIIRHALRTLIKQGNKDAMGLLGVSHEPRLSVTNLNVSETVKMNTSLEFSFEIKAKENVELIVDYILYFQNKSGQPNSRKVFKLKKFSLSKNKATTLTKLHLMRENMTTRKLFRGEHGLEIQINGKSFGKQSFWVV